MILKVRQAVQFKSRACFEEKRCRIIAACKSADAKGADKGLKIEGDMEKFKHTVYVLKIFSIIFILSSSCLGNAYYSKSLLTSTNILGHRS